MKKSKNTIGSAVLAGLILTIIASMAPVFAQKILSPNPSRKDSAKISRVEDYSKPVSIPRSINQNLTSPSPAYMKSVLGVPGSLTTNCSSVTNSTLKKYIITKDVGPFSITGLKPAVEAIERIMTRRRLISPTLYSQTGTAGMLCVRKVRGGSDFSNHSWGAAIDIKMNGKLDVRGDDKTQLGLRYLYSDFYREGFFWGAGFSTTEDSMHFEVSREQLERWRRGGQLP
jgi:hypothetical protein